MRHPPPGSDLVAPELPLVALGEAADHDGDGQREDEDPAQRAQPADQLAQECPKVLKYESMKAKVTAFY